MLLNYALANLNFCAKYYKILFLSERIPSLVKCMCATQHVIVHTLSTDHRCCVCSVCVCVLCGVNLRRASMELWPTLMYAYSLLCCNTHIFCIRLSRVDKTHCRGSI